MFSVAYRSKNSKNATLKPLAFAVLLAVLLLNVCLFPLRSLAKTTVSGECAVLYEPSTHTFVYKKNHSLRRPMASTTKIMTALLAIENANLSDVVTVTAESVGVEGSSVCLVEGERLSMKDLLYLMMLESANDAASAIAIYVGGSIAKFAEMMNERASVIGLNDTNFKNPHGLPSKDHYTSAADLARLTAEALKNDTFAEIVSTKSITLKIHNGETSYTASNHNKLLRMYDGATGVKTGFTKKSGRCLVGAAERNGVSLICVTLNASDDWNDHIRLFDHGFELFERIELAAANQYSYTLPVLGGTESDLRCFNTESVSAVLPKKRESIETKVELNRALVAPIERGETVGYVTFTCEGATIATLPIVASKSIFSSSGVK